MHGFFAIYFANSYFRVLFACHKYGVSLCTIFLCCLSSRLHLIMYHSFKVCRLGEVEIAREKKDCE